MSTTLGQQVVVLNRASAAGSVGAESVANAQPDGYTLVLTSVGALGALAQPKVKEDFECVGALAIAQTPAQFRN